MRVRNPIQLMWWGTGLTTVSVPIVAAVLGSNLVMIPMVFLGAGAVAARVFWRWRAGHFRDTLLAVINEPSSRAVTVSYLIAGIGLDALAVSGVITFTVHFHQTPCFCGTLRSMLFLAYLALSALAFSVMTNLGFLTTVISIFRLVQRARS